MREQLRQFNYIRALAILSVIAIHVTSGYVLTGRFINSRTAYVVNQGTRYSVPLFIIISGYLLLYSSLNRKTESYIDFFSRRFKKVLIPYLIWTVFYTIYYQYEGIIEFGKGLSHVYYNFPIVSLSILNNLVNGLGHLYFIVIIIQLYLLYPLIKKYLELWPNETLAICFILSFYFQAADYLIQYNFVLLPTVGYQYYGILFPSWLFYFVFGMFCARCSKESVLVIENSCTLLGIIWTLSLFALLIDSKLSSTMTTSLKPTIMMYTIISFLFFYSVFSKPRVATFFINKLLNWISTNSFLIYFSHIFVLSEIRFFADRNSLNYLFVNDTGMVFLFVITTMLTFILCFLINLSPLATYLGGMEGKTKVNIISINEN